MYFVNLYFFRQSQFNLRVVEGVRLADIPSRDILALLDRPGLKSMRDKLAALERLSPLRQSDTYKMVNSRGMEMAVVRVGGFGPSGITNTISYCHTSREGGVWRLLSEVSHDPATYYASCAFGDHKN